MSAQNNGFPPLLLDRPDDIRALRKALDAAGFNHKDVLDVLGADGVTAVGDKDTMMCAWRTREQAALNALIRLGGEPGQVRLAVQGAAATGDPSMVGCLVERMFVPALARTAGRSFTLITGIPLTAEGLEGRCRRSRRLPMPMTRNFRRTRTKTSRGPTPGRSGPGGRETVERSPKAADIFSALR